MTRRRTTNLAALIALALAVSVALAPVAGAQTVPILGEEEDNGPVSEIVDKTQETVKETTTTVQENAPEPVKEVTTGVGSAAEETWSGVEKVGTEIKEQLGGETTTTPPKKKNEQKKGGGNGGPGGGGNRNENTYKREQIQARRAAAAAQERHRRSALDRLLAFEKGQEGARSIDPASFTASNSEPLLTQVAQAAVEAARKLGFPMVLTLMVIAFLIVQGRIDRKDAKLALAPISSEEELLSFQ